MKFFASMILFAVSALAQNAVIGLPSTGQKVTAGSEIVVQVQRPNSLTPSKEMAVAIGFSSCASSPCSTPEEVMGTILYNGSFDPEYHESSLPPYENFTVTVPQSAAKGNGQINVAHATLIGAGPFPYLETLNTTVIVA